jgi:hypothetical protein
MHRTLEAVWDILGQTFRASGLLGNIIQIQQLVPGPGIGPGGFNT